MQNLFDHEISSKEFTLEIVSVKESSCWFFHAEGESMLFFLTDFTGCVIWKEFISIQGFSPILSDDMIVPDFSLYLWGVINLIKLKPLTSIRDFHQPD